MCVRRNLVSMAILFVSAVLFQQSIAADTPPTAGEVARAEEARRQDGIAAAKESLRKALLPLSPAVGQYDKLLAGLDRTRIASVVTALDEYRGRFVDAPQRDRDKAFVLFYRVYVEATAKSFEFECKGMDEPADHIAEVKKLADKAGLRVYGDSEGGREFGSVPEFLLDTFERYVSPDLVEYLRIKALDLKTGTMCDGELALSIPELGERCAKWGRFLHKYPHSLIRLIAQAHYERDLWYLLNGTDYGGPFGSKQPLSKTLVDPFLSTYKHIIEAYPEIPLSAFLREYLDETAKTDLSERETRAAFLKSRKVLQEQEGWGSDAFMPDCDCRCDMSWEQVQRECLGHAKPAVGVLDAASGKVTRIEYSATGVSFPGNTYKQEFVLRAAWTDTTFFTVVERGPDSSGAAVGSDGRPRWSVREFDSQCRLLGTTPTSAVLRETDFEGRYCYDPKQRRLLGELSFVGGPTPDRTIALIAPSSGGARVTMYSCEPWAKKVLFEDKALVRAGVSPDMRYVVAVLRSPSEVRLIDTSTGESKKIVDTKDRVEDRIPVWSPDGKTVAIAWPESDDECSILLYSLDTGEVRRVTPENAKMSGSITSLVFIDAGHLLFRNWGCGKHDLHQLGAGIDAGVIKVGTSDDLGADAQWVAMDIATCKAVWTLPDLMRYVTVFDSGKKIAAFFPEPPR